MLKTKLKTRQAFTITEVAFAVTASTIVMLSVGIALVGSHQGWQRTYNRVYSDVVVNSYVSRSAFDALIRKASAQNISVDGGGAWLEVNYYQDANSIILDRYARFYKSGGDLKIEYGTPNPRGTLSIQTLCQDVSQCIFKRAGSSAQMILTLDNGSQRITTLTSAVLHNQ